ncbi:MAG: DISARM system helicase DrmA [Thermoplasmatales archaeon]|nr:DISARM system helicase DrmA [Thermoplasmatales archaeon]
MREKLIEGLIREVYGPRGGVEESLKGDPSKEYIAGVIAPLRFKILENSPDSENTESGANDRTMEDDTEETSTNSLSSSEIDPRSKPSSFGVSFVVSDKNPCFRICVTWGRYFKGSTEDSWKRKSFKSFQNVKLIDDSLKIQLYLEDSGSVNLRIRKVKKEQGTSMVIVKMVNELQIKNGARHGDPLTEACLFQPSLRIVLDKGFSLASLSDIRIPDGDIFRFLYREKPVFAKGIMCSAIWSEIDYPESYLKVGWQDGYGDKECEEYKRPDVRSEFLPLIADPTPLLDWDSSYGSVPELSAYLLSEMWDPAVLKKSLFPLVNAYEKWIYHNRETMNKFGEVDKKIASVIIDLQSEFLERLKSGIGLLERDENVRLSFCFANRAIWLQSKWKGVEQFKWKPFQLAFLLINAEPIVNVNSKYRNITDLLWIPTGGGKTEAYLAIMAFLIAYRRRKALLGYSKENTGGGTAVLTRYTLRLLTTQQFRRILRMITAAEFLRVKKDKFLGWRPSRCNIEGDWIYGSTRFSAGLWVGGGVTPNHLRGTEGAMHILKGDSSTAELAKGEPAQLTKCPVCGTWLSIPKAGLPEKVVNVLHLLLKADSIPDRFEQSILTTLNENNVNFVKGVTGDSYGMPAKYIDLVLTIQSDRKLLSNEIDDMWKKIEQRFGFNLIPIRASRLGYFGVHKEPGRKNLEFTDFEIYCPNPNCELNNNVEYSEGVPNGHKREETEFPDKLVKRISLEPFFFGKRIPITAYTVDEQIYHRCPSVVVSTVDKIARLAFEPRAAGILGNVENYSEYYGYYRGTLLPENTTKKATDSSNERVHPFSPPEMILQDELHLIEGPLGSMFGLYENTVEALIRERGVVPKYIVSTATIRNADIQIKKLFARIVRQFPPNGLNIDDNFFIRPHISDDKWNEETPGRIYAGVYSPGWGPHTPNIRLWSSLLKKVFDNRNEKFSGFYWTLVGYFNSVKELAGTRGLYRADIIERMKSMANGNQRVLDQDKVVELSSRVNSTDIPQILDQLERGIEGDPRSNPDAIFTTSMFGTGVDIPHLSLMIVNGQPKTATQYLQATGRVGREHGALVVTFLRAGRPRDLSHYEMFTAFHQRKYFEVEPSSVNPFAEGCMAKAIGPASVAFLRIFLSAKVNWTDDDALVIAKDETNSQVDIKVLKRFMSERLAKIVEDKEEIGLKTSYFDSQMDLWKTTARKLLNSRLTYFEYAYYEAKKNVVLGDPYHKRTGITLVYDNAPQSLREVEETTGFLI